MSKVAIITDTHIGKKAFDRNLNEYFLRFMENTFFPEIEKRGIKHIIHLGDLFDRREYIDFDVLNSWRGRVFDRLKNYKFQILVGNHDCYYKNTNKINSLYELLYGYTWAEIHIDPVVMNFPENDVLFLPWISPENQKQSMDLIQSTNAKFVMGHLEVQGFKMNSGIESQHGLDPKIFDRFKRVLTGHFHCRSTNGKIVYLGSPYPMDWGDYGDLRGFNIFDLNTGELEFVENPESIFMRVDYTDSLEFDTTRVVDKFVKVAVIEKNDAARFEKFMIGINQSNPISIAVVESFLDEINSGNDPEAPIDAKDTLQIIYDYVDNAGIEKKTEIKEIFHDLYIGAIEQMRSGS
jgi:DNA repair exonuclease SbcCD nuclease subunit